MEINERKQQLVDDLSIIEDSEERFGYVIDKGRQRPGLDDEYKTDVFRIEGCVSNLWLVPSFENGRCHFKADADSMITKGIATLLVDLYDDATPEEILSCDPDFLGEVGITQHLSPNRRNGLANICERIQSYAEHCLQNN